MKYMGSKARIVMDILPIMLDDKHDTFVDCFMGSGTVIGNVSNKYRRIANDKNKYLVAMFKSLTEGKKFPSFIPREFYNDVRDCRHGKSDRYQDDMVGWVGFMASFNGRFFDGGYSGHNVVGSNGKSRDYIKEQISNTRSELGKLMGVEFHEGDYQDLYIPDKSIIYCDIPYRDTKQYDVSRNFDYERFYSWCREKTKQGHKVFISEYWMPDDFTCVWQKQVTNSLNPTKTKRPIEKLFTIMEKTSRTKEFAKEWIENGKPCAYRFGWEYRGAKAKRITNSEAMKLLPLFSFEKGFYILDFIEMDEITYLEFNELSENDME